MKNRLFRSIQLLFGLLTIGLMVGLCFGIDPMALGAGGLVLGLAGAGTVTSVEPLTTDIIDTNAPRLLLDDIDKEVVKMWPAFAPLDQLFRTGLKGSRRNINSMTARHYSVEVKPFSDVTTGAITASNQSALTLPVGNINLYGVGDTIFIPSVKGYAEGQGTTLLPNAPLQLYVYQVNKSAQTLDCVPVNGDNFTTPHSSLLKTGIQNIGSGAGIVIGGRALQEMDVQTSPSTYTPEDDYNYCQYFGSQIEISKWAEKSIKEVNFNEADQMELAMYEYRVKREIAYWWGTRNIIYPAGKPIYTCGGITNFVTNEVDWTALLDGTKPNIKPGNIDEMVSAIYAGNAGHGQRWMFIGEYLWNAMKRTEDIQKTLSAKESQHEFGLYFNKINTGSGELILIPHPLFAIMGWGYNAVVLDVNNLGERHFQSQSVDSIDKKALSQANSDAKFISEVSCPVVKYAKTHTVIKGPVYTSLV